MLAQVGSVFDVGVCRVAGPELLAFSKDRRPFIAAVNIVFLENIGSDAANALVAGISASSIAMSPELYAFSDGASNLATFVIYSSVSALNCKAVASTVGSGAAYWMQMSRDDPIRGLSLSRAFCTAKFRARTRSVVYSAQVEFRKPEDGRFSQHTRRTKTQNLLEGLTERLRGVCVTSGTVVDVLSIYWQLGDSL